MNESLKPCPFCGGTNIQTAEGSTFRWVHAYCAGCGAQSCEVRKATLADDQTAAQLEAEADAIAEWNTRVSDRSDEGADSATAKPERDMLIHEWAVEALHDRAADDYADLTRNIGTPEAQHWAAQKRQSDAALRTAIEELARQAAEWRGAIEYALMVNCIDLPAPTEGPKEALARLVAWEVQIALDPAVSEAAQALVDKGRSTPPAAPEPGALDVRLNEDGTLDEVVGTGRLHLEQMDGNHWWMLFEDSSGAAVHVNLTARGKITAHFEREQHDPAPPGQEAMPSVIGAQEAPAAEPAAPSSQWPRWAGVLVNHDTDLGQLLREGRIGGYSGPPAEHLWTRGEDARRVYLVATGIVSNGRELYERHDDAPPPLCDAEALRVEAVTAPQQENSHE